MAVSYFLGKTKDIQLAKAKTNEWEGSELIVKRINLSQCCVASLGHSMCIKAAMSCGVKELIVVSNKGLIGLPNDLMEGSSTQIEDSLFSNNTNGITIAMHYRTGARVYVSNCRFVNNDWPDIAQFAELGCSNNGFYSNAKCDMNERFVIRNCEMTGITFGIDSPQVQIVAIVLLSNELDQNGDGAGDGALGEDEAERPSTSDRPSRDDQVRQEPSQSPTPSDGPPRTATATPVFTKSGLWSSTRPFSVSSVLDATKRRSITRHFSVSSVLDATKRPSITRHFSVSAVLDATKRPSITRHFSISIVRDRMEDPSTISQFTTPETPSNADQSSESISNSLELENGNSDALSLPASSPEDDTNIAGIVGGSIAGVGAVGAGVGVAFILKRKFGSGGAAVANDLGLPGDDLDFDDDDDDDDDLDDGSPGPTIISALETII
jgi:hypothetical protein